MTGGLWVVCSERFNDIGTHVYQLLSKARLLADLQNKQVTAIYIGDKNEVAFDKLFHYGAHEVLHCVCPVISRDIFIKILSGRFKAYKPELILFPASDWGRCGAAELAIELKAGLTAECIDVGLLSKGKYLFSRAALSDSIIAGIECMNTDVQMCTVKKNAFQVSTGFSIDTTAMRVTTEKMQDICQIKPFYEKISSIPLEQTKSCDLDKAKIVFGVGRGAVACGALPVVKRISSWYGAEIAGTRTVVEDGYIKKERQVGQSGIHVAPKIYIAFGISGATQHIVGLKNAGTIISVNLDAEAPICKIANYVIVADCMEILQQMEVLAKQ